MSGVLRSVRTPLSFRGEREEAVMATRDELPREVGELAHHNEKTYFG
jgi:hypothetical protein